MINYLCALALSTLPCLVNVPDWLTATWIGWTWGAFFVQGLSSTWMLKRWYWYPSILLLLAMVYRSGTSLTDLSGASTAALAVGALASGWLTGILLVPWKDGKRVPGKVAMNVSRQSFTLWDLHCATAVVATFCGLFPLVKLQSALVFQMAPALIFGALLSALALVWTWRPTWSPGECVLISTLALAAVFLAGVGSVSAHASSASFVWVFTGPVVAVFAQVSAVLILSLNLWSDQTQHFETKKQCLQLFNGDFESAHLDSHGL